MRTFEDDSIFRQVQRNPFSSILWIQEGQGNLQVDFAGYDLQKDSVLFLSPFQPYFMEAVSPAKGLVIDFHTDFFCLMKHQKEAGFAACFLITFMTRRLLNFQIRKLLSLNY